MSRIRGFSATAIERAISSASAARKRRIRGETIFKSQSISQNNQVSFEFEGIDFDPRTRASKVRFTQITEYRTIERYVTSNYVRYPVYSDMKEKEKEISKTLRLTNEKLEGLRSDEDELISYFASEIVEGIGDRDLLPSWYCADIVDSDCERTLADISKRENDASDGKDDKLSALEDAIRGHNETIQGLENEKATRERTAAKHKAIIERVKAYKKSVILDIATLFMHRILSSQWRERRHEKVLSQALSSIKEIESKILSETTEKNKNEASIGETNAAFMVAEKGFAAERKKAEDVKNDRLSSIVPLPPSPSGSDAFVSLKKLFGYSGQRTRACYVLRNKENGKCYVGCSDDTVRRIVGSFDGFVPKNPTMAKDYYESSGKDKDDLFEARIIPVATKDEMDSKKKELIQMYDSFEKGYNKIGKDK